MCITLWESFSLSILLKNFLSTKKSSTCFNSLISISSNATPSFFFFFSFLCPFSFCFHYTKWIVFFLFLFHFLILCFWGWSKMVLGAYKFTLIYFILPLTKCSIIFLFFSKIIYPDIFLCRCTKRKKKSRCPNT